MGNNKDGKYFSLNVDEALSVKLGIEGVEHSWEGNRFSHMI